MTTATEAETKESGIGPNGINSTPRRGGESIETLACVIRIATTAKQQKRMVSFKEYRNASKSKLWVCVRPITTSLA